MTDEKQYKEAMQKVQSKHREKVRAATDPDRALVLVHTGNGKGKSSSAFGVIVRALGWGKTVGVVQFIKGKWITGERQFFEKLDDDITWHTMGDGFTWDTQDRAQDIATSERGWLIAEKMLGDPSYDLVVLDELTYLLTYKYLDNDKVLDVLQNRPVMQHVIVTGRAAPEALCEMADTVSKIDDVKHAYKSGIQAQKGIDL